MQREGRPRSWKRLIAPALAAFPSIALLMAATACGGGAQTLDAGPADSYETLVPQRVDSLQIYVVRQEDGSFVALYATNPGYGYGHTTGEHGCTVPWRPDFVFDGTGIKGWFRDPCSGATFDATGHRIFGPAESDLDRFPVSVRHGHVYVDTSRLICPPRQVVHCKVDGLGGG